MVDIIIKLFVKNRDDTHDPAVRRAYGTVSGVVGIFLNVLLFGIKYFAGAVSGSIAIISDAFNNLSDAGSSVITLLGFKLAGAKPDDEHPYGHGRMEYIAGFIVSVIIIVMGVELGKSSIEKIISPEAIVTDTVSIIILIASIFIKLYMFLYNRSIAKKIDSPAIRATAADSVSDTVATAVVLISTLLAKFFSLNLDGWCGIFVALFILKSGIGAAKDTLGLLIGHGPDPELVENIKNIVMAHPEIIGIHDLMVHDYGPGRVMISLHGEVSGDGDLIELHDVIDSIEHELREKIGCIAVIHMDPIDHSDEKTVEILNYLKSSVKEIDPKLTVHDLRIVTGPTHTNVIFDAVKPRNLKMTDGELRETLKKLISDKYENTFAVIDIDQDYV